MIGIIVNVISVAVGGVCGTLFGHKMSQAFTEKLTCVFGVCAMGMGISSIVLMENMPAVILAVVAALIIVYVILIVFYRRKQRKLRRVRRQDQPAPCFS